MMLKGVFTTASATAGKTMIAMATVWAAILLDPRAVATACQQLLG